ncbi:patatin-like phospholipase family protein [Luteimicrobium sp. NPDC057192]|uniref:patatin-like phospholipase family protein n=1 Tax=Luteimicrobium sp. NPDC057192 TaxID=3346042 RepID=UPI003625B59D
MSTTSSSLPVDATARVVAPGDRALVLGGGGAAGNAWLIGVLAGLSDGGLDVTTADLTVGTSAGATTAAQLGGATPAALFAATVVAPPTARPAPAGAGRDPVRAAAEGMARTQAIIDAASDVADMRRRMGAAALDLEATSDGSWPARWRGVVGGRLPSPEWPERTVALTAVDARTGEPVVFDRRSGVELVDAVAASCSSGQPYAIGDSRYIDGGYRRNENADLAAGHARVLVLSPFGGRSRHPHAWGSDLATQVAELRAGGSVVETVFPDAAAEHLFGANAVDLAARPTAARAGRDQGLALAGRLNAFWA